MGFPSNAEILAFEPAEFEGYVDAGLWELEEWLGLTSNP